MTVYMFPGQGSQVKGMGADLFNQFPELVKQANDLLCYSIEDLCINDPRQQLGKTEYTQPALYVVEALSFLAKRDDGILPNYCIGHSLGEYAALFAAGGFDFITGLKLVKKRGELMAKSSGGGMLAVINLRPERIINLLQMSGLNSIDFANYNSDQQVVLSGPAADINKASEILSKEAMMCVPLNVSGAFHSRYMQSAADEFAQFIASFELSHLHTPVISNVTAQPYTDDVIKENLIKQITSSIRWTEIMRYVRTQGETECKEIGPGTVLTRLWAAFKS